VNEILVIITPFFMDASQADSWALLYQLRSLKHGYLDFQELCFKINQRNVDNEEACR
jgi:hypothetical protein